MFVSYGFSEVKTHQTHPDVASTLEAAGGEFVAFVQQQEKANKANSVISNLTAG